MLQFISDFFFGNFKDGQNHKKNVKVFQISDKGLNFYKLLFFSMEQPNVFDV